MLFVVTVLAQAFKVIPRQRYARRVDVPRRQICFVVHNLGRFTAPLTGVMLGGQESVTAIPPRRGIIELFSPRLHVNHLKRKADNRQHMVAAIGSGL